MFLRDPSNGKGIDGLLTCISMIIFKKEFLLGKPAYF